MATIKVFFSKSRNFFPVFEKGQGRDLSTPPTSYTPVAMRACRILFLNKFTTMKLKTDVLSVSIVSFKVLCV